MGRVMPLSSKKTFRTSDWIACWATVVISLVVYTLTLQPTVGLEDSGELVVASDYLGVPHPPGYPIWSLLTWFFQWIFHPVTFHGQPNPAWGVNFFSAFSGAAACGVLALLISRSGFDLLKSLKKESDILGEKTCRLFASAAGISGGLLLAFGQGMWSQAVIAEVYTLNIFFQSLLLVFLYRWMAEPKQSKWLMLCGFVFGLGITNHQTLLFMGLAIAVAVLCNDLEIFKRKHLGHIGGIFTGLAITTIGIYHNQLPLQIIGIFLIILASLLIRHPFLLRDFIITGSLFLLLFGFNKWAAESPAHANWMWTAGPAEVGFWVCTIFALAVPTLATFLLPNGRVVGPTFLLIFVGLSFYFYMAFSSEQNPPINWGYPRTWQGFMHAITRGQYERVKLASVFTPRFLEQIGTYLMDLRSQFYWPIAVLASVPFLFVWKFGRKNICWIVTTCCAFVSVGIIFMVLQNPKTDIQNLFIGRVQYIQSHAIFVLWLGYGILLLLAYFATLARNHPITRFIGTLLVLLLPFALVYKNYNDADQIKVVGGAEQDRHDFGWQFGNWQLRGVEGIKDDLRYWHSPEEFEAQWAAYPNKAYPPSMGTNAIFFGGTDPGRFVPTYMIYSAKVRPDIYLITQNALADNTYMNVMRDLYGDQIWIPAPRNVNLAFQTYIQRVESGKIQAGAEVSTEGSRVQVQGVGGVMQINAMLARQIFDHNQYRTEKKTSGETRPVGSAVVYDDPPIHPSTGRPPRRAFYVEESYVMPWMYPYLTPHGLIMKINNQPTPLTDEMARNDADFWNWYCNRLLGNRRFLRDIVARKSFSKLRTALAGLYFARGRFKEAEAAFRQAVALYDLSPEANLRLAHLIVQQDRHDEAISILDTLYEKDPNNEKVAALRQRFGKLKALNSHRLRLERKIAGNTFVFNDVLELYAVYTAMGRTSHAELLARNIINSTNINISAQDLLQLTQQFVRNRDFAAAEMALKRYTNISPGNHQGYINLAVVQWRLNKRADMWTSLSRSVEIGGQSAINLLRQDKRFDPIRHLPRFRQIVPPARDNLILPNMLRSERLEGALFPLNPGQ